MIYINEEFATEAEAIEYRNRVYNSYDPLGYGTHIRIFFDLKKDAWIASGSRAESCD